MIFRLTSRDLTNNDPYHYLERGQEDHTVSKDSLIILTGASIYLFSSSRPQGDRAQPFIGPRHTQYIKHKANNGKRNSTGKKGKGRLRKKRGSH